MNSLTEINYTQTWGKLKSRLLEETHFLCSQKDIEEHNCLKCRSLLHEPMQISSCGHVFCKGCISLSTDTPKKCPSCDTPYENPFNDKKTENYIFNLRAKCPNNPEHFQGNIREIIRHLHSDCEDEPYICSCSLNVIRKEKQIHDTSLCPNRMIVCDLCNEKTLFCDLESHKLKTCLFDSCKLCNLKTKRTENDHSSICPEMLVNCLVPTCKEKIARKSMEEHISSALMKHFMGMAQEMEVLKNQVVSLQRSGNTPKQRVPVNQEMSQAQEINLLKKQVVSLENNLKLKNKFYNNQFKWLVGWTGANDLPQDLEDFTYDMVEDVHYTARFIMLFIFVDNDVTGMYLKKILKNGNQMDYQGNVKGKIDWVTGRVLFEKDEGGYVWEVTFDGEAKMIGTWQKGRKRGLLSMTRLVSGLRKIPACQYYSSSDEE